MSQPPEVDSLTVQLGDLSIRVSRTSGRGRSGAAAPASEPAGSEGSFDLVSLARPLGGTEAPAAGADEAGGEIDPRFLDSEPWTWEWETLSLIHI